MLICELGSCLAFAPKRLTKLKIGNHYLSGLVEVDEILIGGVVPRKSIKNHSGKSKAVVLVAVELLEPKGFGRIRLRHFSAAKKDNIE
ncbi:hypothetical protein [Psychromonas ingrahamii]|uniref:hypothetical protein n=1 Tax=Psychromonas ingrahamii TaxID=357794 RepID=UPI0000D8023D